MSEESNWVGPLESTHSTFVTLPLPDPKPHKTVLVTKVPCMTYYKRNLRKEIGSPTAQPASIQDS